MSTSEASARWPVTLTVGSGTLASEIGSITPDPDRWRGHLALLLRQTAAILEAREQETVEEHCRCGHSVLAHDTGVCWTRPENEAHPDPACGCRWYEPASSTEA